MDELEGDGLKETVRKYARNFLEWLKPNKDDSLLVQSLKMIYKVLAVIGLILCSPIILLILLFVFFAAL